MKDSKDKSTIDMFGGKPRGRKRIYANQAERQKAYRERKKKKGLKAKVVWVQEESGQIELDF